MDPLAYYRCIEKNKLKRYTDVKQHIRRCHSSHALPGKDSLEDEVTAFRDVSRNPDEQKWFGLWNNLFRGYKQPASPYVEVGIAELIALIRNHAEPLLVTKLSSWLQDIIDIKVDERTVLHLGKRIISEIFEAFPATQNGVNEVALAAATEPDTNTVFGTSNSVVRSTNDQISVNTMQDDASNVDTEGPYQGGLQFAVNPDEMHPHENTFDDSMIQELYSTPEFPAFLDQSGDFFFY